MNTLSKTGMALVVSIAFISGLFGQAIKVNPSGSVGIAGNPNDSYKLTVNGASNFIGNSNFTGTLQSGKIGVNDAPSSSYELYVNGRGRFTTYCSSPTMYATTVASVTNIYNSTTYGKIEFKTDNVTSLKIHGGTETTKTLDVIGTLWLNGNTQISSDERLKKDIASIEGNTILNKIKNLEGKKYKFKDAKEMLELHNSGQAHFDIDTINLYEVAAQFAANDKDYARETENMDLQGIKQQMSSKYFKSVQKFMGIEKMINDSMGVYVQVPRYDERDNYGFLAQDVMKEFPELVAMDSISGLYSVNYIGFIPILMEAIKSQQQQIDELKLALKGKSE